MTEKESEQAGNAANKGRVLSPLWPPIFPRLHSHLQESPLCLSDMVSAGPAGRLLSLPAPLHLCLLPVPIAPSPWLQVIMAIQQDGHVVERRQAQVVEWW